METQTLTSHFATVSFDNSSILRIKFAKMTIDIAEAKAIYEIAAKLSGNIIHANLVDSRDLIFMTNEARKYFATMDKSTVKAIAVLINSKVQESIANMYLKFSKPKIPTKMFTNENDAIAWMKSQLISFTQ